MSGRQRAPEPPRRPEENIAGLSIRRVTSRDRVLLTDIWLRSVRATHTFLSGAEMDALAEPAAAYLTAADTDLWILAGGRDEPVGFMGLEGNDVASLFVAPEAQGRGGGRRLIEHAARACGDLTVTVNEQKTRAVGFYEACGFVTEGRSDLDDEGRPYPVLSMRRSG